MKVWIDPDLCTGVALCQQTCPELFVIASTGSPGSSTRRAGRYRGARRS